MAILLLLLLIHHVVHLLYARVMFHLRALLVLKYVMRKRRGFHIISCTLLFLVLLVAEAIELVNLCQVS